MSTKVIVFGPTGDVGSAAARVAAELGADVVLAMRDTSKSIPGLSAEQEKQGKFERVQADLSKSETVADAITETGAKRAFFYLMWRSPDSMRSTIEAMKTAGIELAVFLSSFTVQGDPKTVPADDFIGHAHAQVEVSLADVFGPEGFVAARGGSFASNALRYKQEIAEGVVSVWEPSQTTDNIAPEDIGRVAGTALAKGQQHGQSHVYCYGPEIITTEESIQVIAKVLGKQIEVKKASKEEAMEKYGGSQGFPPPLAEYFIKMGTRGAVPSRQQLLGFEISPGELRNIETYTGRKATTFDQSVQQNKEKLTA